jgi:K+ transport systems, NAD-binding component
MLKSLGVTIAQLSQRVRGAPTVSGFSDDDRAEISIHRAEWRRRMKTVITLAVVFIGMVALFSTLFHELMAREGRSYSWPTSVYWTLTTMTTLGFGDITFESDAGRVFSVVVLLSGSTFLLVMLPFVFIQFVFVPWMNERDRRRAPRSLPMSTTGHLIITQLGPVEIALIERAEKAKVPYVVISDDLEAAGRIHDEGRRVMYGPLDDPATYRNARVERAAMVVATRNDPTNTNIAFTVREIAPDVEILATANASASIDILQIAGADHVLQLGEILGAAMASRTLGIGGTSHVIGEFEGLKIAEAGVVGTDMAGKSLAELALRRRLGVGIIGIWDRGEFSIASGETVLEESMILLLAATEQQLAAFDAEYTVDPADTHRAVIGRANV